MCQSGPANLIPAKEKFAGAYLFHGCLPGLRIVVFFRCTTASLILMSSPKPQLKLSQDAQEDFISILHSGVYVHDKRIY
jgi:hypothetical protein